MGEDREIMNDGAQNCDHGRGKKEPDAHSARSSVSASHHSARYLWYVIFLLSVVSMFNYMDRMALAVLAPFIKADLELSDAELGLLTGFAFALFYAICGIPIARWADRGTRRNIIAIALAMWSVFTALSGAAQNFWHLFAARVGVGVGEAGCYPPSLSMICDYVPLKRRSGFFGIHAFGLYAGMMLGMALAGWLGEAIGWRWTFVALGLPGIALAVVVRFTLREPVRGFFDAAADDKTDGSFGSAIGVLWRCRTYRLLIYFFVANGFVVYGLTQWWPSFYVRIFGLGLSSVGVYLGIAIGTGSGIGVLVGGLMANKAARRDIRLPLMICAAATSLAILTALGTLFVPSAVASMVLVWLTSLLWGVLSGPVLASLYSVSLPQMRATAGAIATFATSVLGFGLGPFCVGFLSDRLMPSFGTESLRYALLAPICFMPAAVIALLAAARTLPNDLKEAGAPAEDVSLATAAANLTVTK